MNSHNSYSGAFKTWLDNKVKDVYPITDSKPEIVELKEGDFFDLSPYVTI